MNTLPSKSYKSKSPQDTHALAAQILDTHPGRVILALSGNLGTGKTVFVQGLALALGSKRPVTSPTFTLLNEYPCSRPLYHADLYRIEKPSDADALDLDDYMETQGVTAVEWPEKAPHLFPRETIYVKIEMTDKEGERLITVKLP